MFFDLGGIHDPSGFSAFSKHVLLPLDLEL